MSNYRNDENIHDWDETPIHPVKIGNLSSSISSADLKSQLSQLQQKLNLSNIRPVRAAPNTEPEIFLPPSFTNINNDNNNIISTNTSNTEASKIVNNTDKSVDFLGDLSDGLLIESRKLNYENKQFKRKLLSLTTENDSMKKQISNLNLLNNQLSKKEEESNDKIWNLESDINNLKKSIEKTKSELLQSQTENKSSINLIEELKNSVEVLKNDKNQLIENSNILSSKLNSQLSELKEENNNLNDENDILHKNIIDLKDEVSNLKSINSNKITNDNINNKNSNINDFESSFDYLDDSIIHDPIPLNLSSDEILKLDTETLRKNLNLTYHQLLKLRNQNSKIKSDLIKLKRKSLSPTKSQIFLDNINDENENNNSWGNFADDSFVKQNSKSLNNTDNNISNIIPFDDENTNSFLDQIDQSSLSSPKKPITSTFKENYMLIIPKTTLESVDSDIDLKKIDLSEFQTIPIPDKIADKLLSSSSNIAKNTTNFFNDENLQLVSKIELNRLQNPSIDYIKSKSLSHNHLYIPVEEHEKFATSIKESNDRIVQLEKSYNEQSYSLSAIKKQLEDTENLLNVKSKEYETLNRKYENPSLDFMKEKLSTHNYVMLDNTNYKNIQSRIEGLQDKIQDSNKNLTTLKKTIEQLKTEKSDLQESIRSPTLDYMREKSTLLKYAFIPEVDYIQLNSQLTVIEAKLKEKENEIYAITNSKSELESKVSELESIIVDLKASSIEYKSKLKSLEALHEFPGIEYIKEKSVNHGLVALPNDEHNKLKQENIDYSTKVNDLSKEIEDFRLENNKLSISSTEKESKLNSMKIELDAVMKDFIDLKNKLENPDPDYIRTKASLHDLTAIPMEEHESLKENLKLKDLKLQDYAKLKDEIDSKHEEIQTLIASKNELTKSIEVATESLKSREEELKSLKDQLETPTVDYIKDKSQNHGLVVISNAEHDKLQKELSSTLEVLSRKEREIASLQKLKEDLEHQAETQGSKNVSLELHEAVQKDLDETKLELDNHKKQVQYLQEVELKLKTKETEASNLLEKVNTLESKASKLDETIFELETIKSAENDLIKKKQELDEMKLDKCKMQDHLKALQEKETHLSEALQKLESENKELRSIKSSYEEPNFEYLEEKSRKLGYIPIALEEHSQTQSSLAEYKSFQEKNEELEEKIVSLSTKNNELAELNEKLEKEVKKITQIKESLSNPDAQYIKEKSTVLGLISLPITEHKAMEGKVDSLSLQITELQSKIKSIESEKDELNSKIQMLESSNRSPSVDYIKSKSTSLGLIPVPIVEHTSLKSELERKDILLKKNRKQLQELDLLRNDITERKTKLNETVKKLDELTEAYESPNIEYLKEKIFNLGYDAIKTSELEELKNSNKISIAKIDELKEKLISSKNLLEEKDKQLETISNQLEERKKIYESEAPRELDQIDNEKLHSIATSRGLTLLSIADINKGIDMAKSSSVATVTSSNVNDLSSQPIQSIIEYLEPKGYKVLSNEDYAKILIENKDDNELDNLADISHEMSDIESDLESKKHMLEELDNKSRHSISSNSSICSASISVENLLSQKYHKLNDIVLDLSKEIENLNQEKVKVTKQINRLSVSPEEYSNNALTKKLNKKLSAINSKIELKSIELKSQQSALSAVHAYLEKSKGLDLPPITSVSTANSSASIPERSQLLEQIKELQAQYDEKKSEMNNLAKELNESSEPAQLVERLSLLGYSITSPTGDNFMVKEISLNGNKLLIPSIVQTESFDAQTGTLIIDNLSKLHGYSIIPTSDITKNNILTLEELTLDDIKTRAAELGCTVMTNQKINLIIAKSNEPKLPDSFTFDELKHYADKIHMRLISNEDIERLKERKITSRELANKAEELNLVLLSLAEVDELKAHEPVTKENIIEKAKEFDIMCIPVSQFVATTVSRTPDIPNVTVLPNSYYKILSKSHEWYKRNKDKINSPAPKKPETIPETSSFDFSSIVPNTQVGEPHLPANIDTVSLHTVDTVISNRKIIIAAVAQTIMGEYLYKYYRKLGPFSSTSDTRHERYFWIHPYSMTIYWSPFNPVSSDPAKKQIKALSILDVKVVEDRNPLPSGIYHKSIIIKSHDKNIKITCPTRQLHNVWYNSLKFLLDRSTDSWTAEDDLEDQYQQDFSSDNKTKLDRSQTQRSKRISASPSFTSRIESRIGSKSTSLRSLNNRL